MIKNILLAALCILFINVQAQTTPVADKPVYDAGLAKKLGADDYGMKHYVMAFLRTGPVKITDKAELETLQKAHLKNIFKLAEEGKLVIAGPFLDGKDLEGIFVFNVATIEEAKKLTETDPAIKAGILIMELKPWYCSAALIEVMNIHKRIEKKSVVD
ncbi:MAG: YciI-like protein [Mucilaginibacter sp.]|jgi:uncharacterized protein YciI|nr:YciI-like protein [Mucilaginibacter sp.]